MRTIQTMIDLISQNVFWFIIRLLIAAAELVLADKALKRLPEWIERAQLNRKLDKSVYSFMSTTGILGLRVLSFVAAALIIGIPWSVFLTVFASCSVALGLALQGSLSNLAGGLMLMMFRPFSVGDYIIIENYQGTVTQISAFYTTINTIDNRKVTLPNGTLSNGAVMNCSSEGRCLLELLFGIAYSADIDEAKAVLEEVARETGSVLEDPAPEIVVTDLKDSSVELTMRAWVNCAHFRSAKSELLEAGKKALDRAGVRIPYPQVDVHMQ